MAEAIWNAPANPLAPFDAWYAVLEDVKPRMGSAATAMAQWLEASVRTCRCQADGHDGTPERQGGDGVFQGESALGSKVGRMMDEYPPRRAPAAEEWLKWPTILEDAMQITATEAKNRFGYYLGQAEREPVHVMKNDRVAGVIVSAARFAQLEAAEQRKSLAQRKREFNETFEDWIAAQHELVDRSGVFGEEFRTW